MRRQLWNGVTVQIPREALAIASLLQTSKCSTNCYQISHTRSQVVLNGFFPRTVYFGEHRSYGEGAKFKDRVSYSTQLTDSEASAFTSISYIDGDKWLNQTDLISTVNFEEHKEDLISSY